MGLPKLKDLFSGGIEGVGKAFKEVISSFKANPDKVLEHTEKMEQLSNELDIKIQEFKVRLQESEDKAVTERWTADMNSDSWMSKNIRPLSLAACLGFIFLVIIFDSTKLNFEVKNEYIDLIGTILELIVLAYFGGRTVEKGMSIYKTKK